jgi:hypothetical protein
MFDFSRRRRPRSSRSWYRIERFRGGEEFDLALQLQSIDRSPFDARTHVRGFESLRGAHPLVVMERIECSRDRHIAMERLHAFVRERSLAHRGDLVSRS